MENIIFLCLFFVFDYFSFVFDPGDLIFVLVSRFSSPWRPYGPTLWQDYYCKKHQKVDYGLDVLIFCGFQVFEPLAT